nr:immunoglobulin light chain junction region [Macaca mulatta]
CQQGYSYFPTF